jgi:hypothetical protein
MQSAASFDLWDEDGLLFEEHPDWFVLLDRTPIVWTVRGMKYFRPRFALIGVAATAIGTPQAFDQALGRWLDVERELLARKIYSQGAAPNAPLASRCLKAVLDGDADLAERLISQLEMRAQGGLRLV